MEKSSSLLEGWSNVIWQWASIRPGKTVQPAASTTWTPSVSGSDASRSGPTASMREPRINISASRGGAPVPSIRLPLQIRVVAVSAGAKSYSSGCGGSTTGCPELLSDPGLRRGGVGRRPLLAWLLVASTPFLYCGNLYSRGHCSRLATGLIGRSFGQPEWGATDD